MKGILQKPGRVVPPYPPLQSHGNQEILYQASPGSKSITVRNYYTDEDMAIPLDPTLLPLENAKKYFEKYNKMK